MESAQYWQYTTPQVWSLKIRSVGRQKAVLKKLHLTNIWGFCKTLAPLALW